MVSTFIPTTTGGLTYLVSLIPGLKMEPDNEIIIVDNASRDGTGNYLSNHKCTLIINESNLGFAKANNQAARIAQGDYFLLLNNDTVTTPGFINEMVKTFNIDTKIGVVGCLIYTMNYPKRVQHCGVCFNSDYIPYELGLEVPDMTPAIPKNDPRVTSVREVPAVTAACMMVKRSVWEEIGGFDEKYVNGWEDIDFTLKVKEAGYKIWYTGKTYISHKHFGSVGRFLYENNNRKYYDETWVYTGRAKAVLGEVRE